MTKRPSRLREGGRRTSRDGTATWAAVPSATLAASDIVKAILFKKLRIVFAHESPFYARVPDGALGAEGLLLIGDKVVTKPPSRAEFPFDLDLGVEWKRLTGRPFGKASWLTAAMPCSGYMNSHRHCSATTWIWRVFLFEFIGRNGSS